MRIIMLMGVLVFSLVGCDQKSKVLTKANSKNENGGGTVVNLQAQPSMTSMNYQELIRTYSKVTGVEPSQSAIRDQINQVIAQLPLSNDPSSYSAFNQISVTTLAITFCNAFISNNSLAGKIFGVSYDASGEWKNLLATQLIQKMAYTEENEDPFLAIVRKEMMDVMDIKNDPQSIFLAKDATIHRSAVLGCSVFLASNYFNFD